jgi:AcrR family transcriptional regulator
MSPRPRTASDEAILAAASCVIARVGPRFTLAHVAREVGLAPATLVQRFRSKRGLMVALAVSAAGGASRQMAAVRAGAPGPLAALFAVGDCFTRMAPSSEALAHHLAFLQMDLTDPELRRLALEQSRVMRAELTRLLDEAVQAGELKPTDTARLAAAVQALQGGSLLGWALSADGTPQRVLRRDLETLLAPYRRRVRGRAPEGRCGHRRPRRSR